MYLTPFTPSFVSGLALLRHVARVARHAAIWVVVAAASTLAALAAPAAASVANAPGANLEVSLVTYGPGATYWERFGHDAIELRDTVSGEAVNFNYGLFDFSEKDFFVNFARGRMHYLMGASPSAEEAADYVAEGRSITRQRLALDADQAAKLRDFLVWNLHPENAGYPYDYYTDNCTTRVRDALDRVLGGQLRAQLEDQPGGMTFRQQTVRLMSAQPWLMLGLDLGLGSYADQPLDAWRESFLPATLESALRGISIRDGNGAARPLVANEVLVAPNKLDVPPTTPPDLRIPLGATGLAIALLLLATSRYWLGGYLTLGTLYLALAGFVGVVMLALWTLTTHRAGWANANLLLFNPAAWLILPTLWRTRRGLRPSRFIDSVVALQLLAVMIAATLHLLPDVVQQNQPWLLFALPIWIALAWTLRRSR